MHEYIHSSAGHAIIYHNMGEKKSTIPDTYVLYITMVQAGIGCEIVMGIDM